MKRVEELRGLSDDHHTSLVLARRCRQARPDESERVANAARAAFASQLEPHFAIEERHLLPALEAIGEAALADRIRDDHAALRAAIAALATDAAGVGAFGRLLEGHVRFEEREVFERVQGRLPAAALRAIAAACAALPRTCALEI